MEAPEKIYIHPDIGGKEFLRPWLKNPANYESVKYIRKDVVDNILKTAEDHAYFAGSEAMREKMMEKAVSTVWMVI